MDSKYVIDFLMYSYFGNWDTNPLYAAIDRAYRDATMRRALELMELNLKNLKGRKLSKDEEKTINNIIKNIRFGLEMAGAEIIRAYITKNITGLNPGTKLMSKDIENQLRLIAADTVYGFNYDDIIPANIGEDYDAWHKRLCETLVEYYNVLYAELIKQWLPNFDLPKEKHFTYGNAQKWVNMTMKNLLIMSIIKKDVGTDEDWCDKIIGISECFHIPLDSYMFNAIKELGISPSFLMNPEGNKKTTCWSKIGVYDDGSDNHDTPFSYIGYQHQVKDMIYEKFQKSPIEWEGDEWINQAKEENNNFVRRYDNYVEEAKYGFQY
ncbi:MAG: hypothetical protein LUC41_04770 [Clostridiales bacterium]|nr:hypothetical protein [Clostridiales bacterium]